jgi:2-polyprenyl-3-methyl-5-hydroxy-6-metoxy-1,4-benzoquinol methylase
MAVIGQELTAEAYSYGLPDHWIMNPEKATNHFALVHEAYVRRVVEILEQKGAHSVIEVGCGDGWNCGKLVEAGMEVVGTDWSSNAIGYCRLLVPTGEFYCGDIRTGEFRERFPRLFDAAIFVEVLEHIPPDDCLDALNNIADTIKPGGTLVMTTPSTNKLNDDVRHYRHFDEKTIRDLVSQTKNMVIEAIEGYGDAPYVDKMYRKLRWVENRLYSIHPLRKRILSGFRNHCVNTPLDRCEGLIVTMKKK